jgi:hypothetical protein
MAAVSIVALIVSSCGSPEAPPPETTSTSTSATAAPATRASAVVDGVRVTATPSASDRDRELTITAGDAAAPVADALVTATAPISVTFDGGAAQPSAPVELAFDLSNRPDVVASLSDEVIPVVESVSANDPTERDMFTGTWNPATKTLTTEVTHLTDFWVSAFNVLKTIQDGIGKTFDTLVRGDSSSPCREKSELTLDGTEYVLTAVSPGAIAGCLVENDGAIAIDFENATGGFYAIQVAPADIGGNWVVGQALTMGDAAGSMVVGIMPNIKGVLASRSSGRLTLNKGITEGDVRMLPQPHGILVKSLLSAVGMLGLDLKQFDDIPGAWDCFATAVNATDPGSSVTAPALTDMIGDIAQCLITLEKVNTADKAKLAALHRLSIATALLTELPGQLRDFVAAGLEEVGGDSVKDFRLRSTAPDDEEPTEPSSGGSVINRVDVTTWAYDRVEGDTYVADNTGAKQLEIFWKSYAGEDQVRSGCTSTVHIEGPGTSETKESSNCDSYDPGTYLKARSPGVHTVTVTVRQDGQPDMTVQRTVTVLPHG